MRKAVCIANFDQRIWKATKMLARENQVTVAQVVQDALVVHLAAHAQEKDSATHQ